MKLKKVNLFIVLFLTVILTISASTLAIYNNYNSNNANGFTPGNQIDAYNQYQIDGEAFDSAMAPVALINHITFQDWGPNPAPWNLAYNPGTVPNPTPNNGVEIMPGGIAGWTLSSMTGAPPNLYPEVKWGVYRMHLVIISTNNARNIFGPAVSVRIDIEVDGVWEWEGWVNNIKTTSEQSVYNDIWIDFHFNHGQNNEPSWLGQPWWTEHEIRIRNLEADLGNILWLDEFHLTSAC